MPLVSYHLTSAGRKQINQMVAFIHQEGAEKADEILAKAEEDYNIAKGKIVQEGRKQIIALYSNKEKKVLLRRQMMAASMANDARLELLRVRANLIEGVIYQTRNKILEMTGNASEYKKLLSLLIQEGLFKLYEPVVMVRTRPDDLVTVQSVFEEAQNVYEKATGSLVELRIDKKNLLNEISCGGVVMTDPKVTVKVTNTLYARLILLTDQLRPKVRVALFGVNPNRKFDDLV